MPLKDTLTSIKKMGSKDPLKMVFVLLLVSVLPLLVVGTMTQVLLQSRAAFPISGAAGGDNMKLKYRTSMLKSPSCSRSAGTCKNGQDVVIFYNSSNKFLADVKIDKIVAYTALNKQQINPSPVRVFITDTLGSELAKIDHLAPGQEILVAVESNTSIETLPSELRGEIFFSGKECSNSTNNCTSQWAHNSGDLFFEDFIKTAAPAKANGFTFTNQYITASLDGFVVKKDGKFYYGDKASLSTTFTPVSTNELLITAKWTEHSEQVTVKFIIMRNAQGWWLDNISFSNGKSTLNMPHNAYPSASTNAFEFGQFSLGTANYDSFFTMLNGSLKSTWTTSETEQSTGAALFDLNSDKILDLRDYTLLAHSYGKNGAIRFVKADVNGDGTVNKADVDQLISQIKLRMLRPIN